MIFFAIESKCCHLCARILFALRSKCCNLSAMSCINACYHLSQYHLSGLSANIQHLRLLVHLQHPRDHGLAALYLGVNSLSSRRYLRQVWRRTVQELLPRHVRAEARIAFGKRIRHEQVRMWCVCGGELTYFFRSFKKKFGLRPKKQKPRLMRRNRGENMQQLPPAVEQPLSAKTLKHWLQPSLLNI